MSVVNHEDLNAPPAFTRTIRGTFFRAIDPNFREHALAGSRAAGRYSRADQPTLYLSSSVEGVEAAMVAHANARPASLEIVTASVDAAGIVDLRDPKATTAFGVDPAEAAASWQDVVAAGKEPPSWRVGDRLIAAGANGLIDPSRRRSGFWHLVLFRWNEPGVPGVPVVRIEDGRVRVRVRA